MRRYATRTLSFPFPALKGRAKFVPTLRVEQVLLIHNLLGHIPDDWQFEFLALVGFDGGENQSH